MVASLLKHVSDFTADVFSSEKELLSWTYLLKKAPRRTKRLISPFLNSVLKIWGTLFELTQLEVKCSKSYFNFFLEKHGKRTVEVMPKIENKYLLNIYREYFFCQQFNAGSSFWQTGINFVEKRLKFSHFEGGIIP